MEWLELIADWILIPLIIVYGFTSWAKDNPNKSIFGSLGQDKSAPKRDKADQPTDSDNK